MKSNKIKVLIVDDSTLYREVLSSGVASDPSIEVVAKAINAYDARDKIMMFHPDVIICDVQMPGMNGIEFIRQLLPVYPIPVIVVSTVGNAVFDALNAGAIDFVGKPDVNSDYSVNEFIDRLIEKIKIASTAKVTKQTFGKHQILRPTIHTAFRNNTEKIIAIGASTGGIDAIEKVLSSLHSNVPGIVIVQHIQPRFSASFSERLNKILPLTIKEAETGDVIQTGKVLIAPGDFHMRVIKRGNDHIVECFKGERVNRHRPSVDVLFKSVAETYGKNAIGVILTGMGGDGAQGLLSMKKKGARTIGQDEASSVVYGMPRVAYDIGAVEQQVSLKKIPEVIGTILQEI